MEQSTDTAFLRVSPSPYGDAEFKDYPLIHRETWLGRSDQLEERNNLIDLDPRDWHPSDPEALRLRDISRYHATVERINPTTYVLHHNPGKLPIGLYETLLEDGQTHQLRHTDIFCLPYPSASYWIQFFAGTKLTTVGNMPLYIFPNASKPFVYVFNQSIKLHRKDFQFVQYLYERRRTICTNEEITEHLWPGLQGLGRDRGSIEQILVRVRGAFRDVCGFSFIETITNTGYRLPM